MEIVKKCEWCHKTFIAQMITARFCSSKCCDQAYRYKRKVASGKYTPASNDDLSTLARRVDERKHLNESLKDKQFLSPLRLQNYSVFAEVPFTIIFGIKI